jgi:hypothetical protein
MKSITPKSLDKMDALANNAMKVIEEVARHEMLRAGYDVTKDARGVYDNFKTMVFLYMSAVINKTIVHSNAILLSDFQTEPKDEKL